MPQASDAGDRFLKKQGIRSFETAGEEGGRGHLSEGRNLWKAYKQVHTPSGSLPGGP